MTATSIPRTASPPTRVWFFSGLGEIGRNMCAVEVDGRLCVIDVGIAFPDAEHFGVDLILPDWSLLAGRRDDVHCIVATHGHEDHIGAIPFFLREFPGVPVYASRLTGGLLEAKMAEHPGTTLEVREVEAGEQVTTGPFTLEFVGVTHSIPDSFAVAVHTPHGTILHSGDFKLDPTPMDGRPTDLGHLAQLGDDGVALLLGDSTNAGVTGFTPSERTVGKALDRAIATADGLVVVTTFASHVHRVQSVIDAAVRAERLVCFVGRSMLRNMPIARELGYLRFDDDRVVDITEVDRLPRDRVLVICTGSQGEPFAALSRMASGQHRSVSLASGDLVVMASSVIPGNEHAIARSVNGLAMQGVRVVDGRDGGVHVSGHARREELKVFHQLVRPSAVVPVHGEPRHLHAHARLAIDMGAEADQVLVCTDGDSVVLQDGRLRRADAFEPGVVYVDGLGVGDVGTAVLRDRAKLSTDGICIAVVLVDAHRRPIGPPRLVQQGIIYEPEHAELLDEAVKVLSEALDDDGGGDDSQVRRTCTQVLGRFWRERTGRRPVIEPVVVGV